MPPLLPFPYPLRIGTDICSIPRTRRVLGSPLGARFIRRILSPEELARAAQPVLQALEAIDRRRELTRRVWSGSAGDDPRRSRALEDEGGVARRPKALAAWLARLSRSEKRQKLELIDTLEAHEKKHQGLFNHVACHLAGRFAAKEAAFKAFSHLPTSLAFHDVAILTHAAFADLYGDTPPNIRLGARPIAVIKLGPGMRDQTAMVSISHDGEYATAMCLAFEQDPPEDGQLEETAKAG